MRPEEIMKKYSDKALTGKPTSKFLLYFIYTILFIVALGVYALLVFPLMWAWNFALGEVLTLTYWKMFVLFILVRTFILQTQQK